jgi:hypothetical protein
MADKQMPPWMAAKQGSKKDNKKADKLKGAIERRLAARSKSGKPSKEDKEPLNG